MSNDKTPKMRSIDVEARPIAPRTVAIRDREEMLERAARRELRRMATPPAIHWDDDERPCAYDPRKRAVAEAIGGGIGTIIGRAWHGHRRATSRLPYFVLGVAALLAWDMASGLRMWPWETAWSLITGDAQLVTPLTPYSCAP